METAIRACWHVNGDAACGGLAFYRSNPLMPEQPPIVLGVNGLIIPPTRLGVMTCGTCGVLLNRDDVVERDLPGPLLVQRRATVEVQRRDTAVRNGGRRADDVDFTRDDGPEFVTPAQIAKAVGVSSAFVRSELASGEIAVAHKVGTRGDWRVPYAIARRYVQRLTGAVVTAAAAIVLLSLHSNMLMSVLDVLDGDIDGVVMMLDDAPSITALNT